MHDILAASVFSVAQRDCSQEADSRELCGVGDKTQHSCCLLQTGLLQAQSESYGRLIGGAGDDEQLHWLESDP